jgi:molybdate transport system substrate-binding protein
VKGIRLAAAIVAISCLQAGAARAQELAVAAASDLQVVFPQVAARFERDTGHFVRLTFGSSGNFLSQIQNGAPFDLFFSADIDDPRRLEAAGLAEPGTLTEYAVGSIVVWARKDSGVDVQLGLKALDSPRVRKVAIANPEHAPYGRAAVAALQHEQLYNRVKAKFVLGENISQAAQFVQSGNAEAGILALSIARAPALSSTGSYSEIPSSFYPPIDQAAVVIRSSAHKDLARQFLALLKQPDVAALLRQFGFASPSHSGR